MNAYIFLQHYWWFVVSLLGALLVFLLFVQGGNSLLFCLGKTEEQKKMMINSTGRKWEFTFTTLVTFGGAFFASFPLFYSTSFGGAYWLWMIILFSFVLQAVSYEFQSKAGNLLGKTTYRTFLVINGVVGPVLLGGAVATFFTGSNFYINKGNIADAAMPVISQWANGWHGLDALLNPWNVVLGLAVSNGLVALSGALLSQYQGFADVSMGRGAIVIGLAAVIIGEALFSRIFHNFALKLVSVSLGAIIYYIVIQLVLTLGFDANLLKLLSASVVAVFLAVPYWKSKYFAKPAAKKAQKEDAKNA